MTTNLITAFGATVAMALILAGEGCRETSHSQTPTPSQPQRVERGSSGVPSVDRSAIRVNHGEHRKDSKIRVIYSPNNFDNVALSPDGKQFVFTVWNSSPYNSSADDRWKGPSELWILDRSTGSTRRLFSSGLESVEWSPDSRYIAGIVHTYAGLFRPDPRSFAAPGFRQSLVVIDAIKAKQVARVEAKVEANGIWEILRVSGWFPHAHRILFEQYVEARSERSAPINKGEDLMKVLDIVRGKCEVYPRRKAGHAVAMLCVSPKDGRVVATCDDGNLATFEMNSNTLTTLTQDGGWGDGKGHNGWSQWSPDGQRLAYFRLLHSGNPFELWTITRDGKQKSVLAEYIDTSHVVWSPDGSALAWIGREIPEIPPRKQDVVPGVETPISPPRPTGFGPYTGPCCLYIAKVPDGKPRCVLNASVGIAGWDRDGVLVCYSQGAIFEVRP